MKPGAPFVLVTPYGDSEEAEFQDRLNVWKSFWIDDGHEASKVEEIVNKGAMKISFIPEKQIEDLLTESGFTNITRFYSTGIMAGWMCHA